MEFTKMHGAGNDFVVFEGDAGLDYSDLSLKLCERRFSVGADGLMVAQGVDRTTVKMVYYNSDGSRGQMCGNGARCLAWFAYSKGLVKEREFNLKTDAGIVAARILEDESVEIAMGRPVTASEFDNFFSDEEVRVADRVFSMSYLLMGVPHVVIPRPHPDKDELLLYGPKIEVMDRFPQGTNVNFVTVETPDLIVIDTWERGAGNTLACGTGALASVYALNRLGLVGTRVRVEAPGGTLFVTIDPEDRLFLQGGAVIAFEGRI